MTANVIPDLVSIVSDRHVLVDADVTSRYDSYPHAGGMEALCIVRPANTEEVSAVVRYCNNNGLKVIAQGGRTSLVAGAKTQAGHVALSLERMTAMGEPDKQELTLQVEAGAPLQLIQETAAQAGLLYPVDLGARGSATIGGNISTNAGGNSVLRYGMTREQILGLEVVLADGTVLSGMNRMIKNNAGYDLKQMFIGSEGTLGIVTKAVLRLRPDPGQQATAWAGTDSFEDVLALLQLAGRSTNGCLTSFEVMWSQFLGTALRNERHRRPLADDFAFHVLIEVAAADAAGILQNLVERAWELNLIGDAVVAMNDAQARDLWAVRDDIETLVKHLSPVFMYDVSMPQSAMAEYVETLRRRLMSHSDQAKLVVFGHIADGNLHLFITTGTFGDHLLVDSLVYEPLRVLGGSISAEHGIGLEKRDYLKFTRSAEEIELMRLLKVSLDPRNTLNPGKIFAAGEDYSGSRLQSSGET